MKNRTILAFVLSSVVLILWQIMFPQPKAVSTEQTLKNTQHVENKHVTENLGTNEEAEKKVFSGEQHTQKPDEKVEIQNDKIRVTLSSQRGALVAGNILAYDESLSVRGMFELLDLPELAYQVESKDFQKVVFVARNKGLEIRKSYQIIDGEYSVAADMQIKNLTKTPIAVSPNIQAMLLDVDMADEKVKNGRDRNLLEYSVLFDGKVIRKTGAYKFEDKENSEQNGFVDWLGFRNRYYCAIFKPQFSVQGYKFSVKSKSQLSSQILMKDVTLNGGEELDFPAKIYFGPQNDIILSSYGMNFEKIHVYFRAKFFDSIAKIIEDLIKFVHKVTKNWGISIVLVSLLIYLSFSPLTMKSMVSMRRIQGLQPKIVELREKHEANPQKLNQEIMKLYAENKVNPLGGCFPLLLQMPIFICLYQMIWRSVLFKGAGFLWIKDLSQPDRLMVLDKTFPVIGNEINILPLVILVLMFIQQKMNSKNMATTDPNQIAQQKMMTFMMPAVLFFVFYHIASGLTLYFTVFYMVSSVTQWYIGKKEKAVN